ncbi:MAG: hypothetical protein P8X73_18450 [Ignavibacteriaceae bacterium]
MNKLIFLSFLIFIGIISNCRFGFSQNVNSNVWPQFRGINCSGVPYPDQNAPIDLESVEKIVWETPIISGASSPCIWEDNIFLTGFD